MNRVDPRTQHLEEHLPLPVACVNVYYQVDPEASRKLESTADIDRVLNRVAQALAGIAPIYVQSDPSEAPTLLDAFNFPSVRFRRGATVLVAPTGMELRGLTIKRKDMRAAIAILRAAGTRFRG